jgi:kumamolisin
MSSKAIPIAHSERVPVAGARQVAPVGPDEPIEVTVYVRRNPSAPVPDAAPAAPLDDATFRATFGADPADLDRVAAFGTANGLEVVEKDIDKRSVRLRGTARAMEQAFGVRLHYFEAPGERYRGRTGPIYLPPELANVVEAVFGLDNRRVGFARLRRDPAAAVGKVTTAALDVARRTGLPAYTYLPPTIAGLYRFPPTFDGSGQCIAILCFNEASSHGGYSQAALQTYFGQVLHTSIPSLTDVVVHGRGNDPGDDSGRDPTDSSGEVMLDIQMAGGCAPGAKLVVYFSEFTEQGWVDVVQTVITDNVNRPSVLSISYGNPEDDPRSAWTLMAIRKVDEAFAAAAARGITVCCASGDDGSRDQASFGAHADFPASSPHALGCGGTRVYGASGLIGYEAVWNDGPGSASGGGVSRIFPLPAWQAAAGVPPAAGDGHRGRGVPDVSGIADPVTGVVIITLDGQHLAVIGGTSATAPLWSALIARLNQALGRRLGFVNPMIYATLPYGVLRDITIGNNGAYAAGPGWDACTGLGSPDGLNLLAALHYFLSVAPPSAADSAPLAPFESAYHVLLDSIASALHAAPVDGERVSSSAVYGDYVRAVQKAWDNVDPSRLAPAQLRAIGESLVVASGYARSAMIVAP